MSRHRRAIEWGVTALLLQVPVTLTGTTWAYNLDSRVNVSGAPWTWAQGNYTFRINTASFSANLPGWSFTSSQTIFWVGKAANVWSDRIGTQLHVAFAGTSTFTPVCPANIDPANQDGGNDVVAIAGCKPFDDMCEAAISTYRYHNDITPFYNEVDICIWGERATRYGDAYTALTGFATSSLDLPSLLTHEFGHAIGIDHTPNTVMDPGTARFGTGDTLGRYPTFDDREAARFLYGGNPGHRYWKSIGANDASWSPASNLVPGVVYQDPTAALAKRSNTGFKVVSSRAEVDCSRLRFDSANYPLSANSSWLTTEYQEATCHAAAIAGRIGPGPNLWLAAWPAVEFTIGGTCPAIQYGTSIYSLGTMETRGQFAGDCTVHEPAVTFDFNSQRYVMFYVKRDYGLTGLNDRIYARTAVDPRVPSSWTPAQDIQLYTIEAVDIACSPAATNGGIPGECMMAYTRPNGQLATTAFTVNATSGAISVGPSTQVVDPSQRGPGVGVMLSANRPRWFAGLGTTANAYDWVSGYTALWTTDGGDSPIPSPYSNWQWLGYYSPQGPAMAMQAVGSTSTGYVFLVDP